MLPLTSSWHLGMCGKGEVAVDCSSLMIFKVSPDFVEFQENVGE